MGKSGHRESAMTTRIELKRARWGNLEFIPGLNRGRYPYCHTLVWDGDVKIIIDPCCDPLEIQKIADTLKVDAILLSHYHEDHFGWMSKFPDAKLYVHELDAPPLADPQLFLHYYGIAPGSENEKWLKNVLRDFYFFEPRKTDFELRDGQTLDFGDLHIDVIHTPGHSPGHSCFYFREVDILFLADFDLTRFGPWYGDRVSDIDAFIESAKRVRYHPAKLKIVSHDDGVLEGDLEERWTHYLAVIDRRESELLDFLDEPRSIADIIGKRIVYRKARQPASFYDFAEEAAMMKHVERLMKSGVVVREGDRYRKAL